VQGFFTKEDTRSLKASTGKRVSCFSCGLFKECRTPKMEPYGKFKKRILIIGSYLTLEDDKRSIPWQGKEGQLLKEALSAAGVDLFEDCLTIHALACRPAKKATPNQVSICRDLKVLPEIIDRNPLVILLVGSLAVQSFLGGRWQKSLGGIDKWRGWHIPDQDYKAWVCPVESPNDILYLDRIEAEALFKRDIRAAVNKKGVVLPEYVKPTIAYLDNLEGLDKLLKGVKRAAFDYETTGLKPHSAGHRIVCASIAVSADLVYVFAMPDKKKDRAAFVKFLQNEEIGKIASNMKFEDTWSFVRLKARVKNWFWDTMVMAHVLDNRKMVTGLKFQTYVRLGIVDYDSHISPLLKGPPGENNGFNKLLAVKNDSKTMKSVMEYCGLDSINEYRVFLAQQKEIEERILPF
jgi:uracil-DNA glycosylase family 4